MSSIDEEPNLDHVVWVVEVLAELPQVSYDDLPQYIADKILYFSQFSTSQKNDIFCYLIGR